MGLDQRIGGISRLNKCILSGAAAVLITGCGGWQTMAELQSTTPLLTVETSATVEQLRDCVYHWMDNAPPAAVLQYRPEGVVATVHGNPTGAMFSILNSEGIVKLHCNPVWCPSDGKKWDGRVAYITKTCAADASSTPPANWWDGRLPK